MTADGGYFRRHLRALQADRLLRRAGYTFMHGTSHGEPARGRRRGAGLRESPGRRGRGSEERDPQRRRQEGVPDRRRLVGRAAEPRRDAHALACCHPRPQAASPLSVSLVPAFNQCTSPNRLHGPPNLPGGTNPDGSCAPPGQRSAQATVGTPDANGAGRQFRRPAPNEDDCRRPGHAGDQADVGLFVNITDVRAKTAGVPGLFGAAPGTHDASHRRTAATARWRTRPRRFRMRVYPSPCLAQRPPVPPSGRHARSRRP